MKKTVLALLAVLVICSTSFGITLVEKSETSPEFILSGHVWLRHTLNYSGLHLAASQLTLSRNYISFKLNGADYSSNITLDIVNRDAAQGKGDFQVWVKLGYVELTKIPLLSDAGIVLRGGIQLMYTGTNPIWKYNLYEVPVEGRAGLSSADMGLALAGSLLDKKLSYELAMYSGDGYAEMDMDLPKAVCANVNLSIIDGLNLILTYYNKSGLNTSFDDPKKNVVSEAVLAFKAGMLVDSYAAVIEKCGPKSGTNPSGVMHVLSLYAGVKPLDWLSVHARVDLEDTDTALADEEITQYYAGLLIPVAGKVNLMLDYSLKTKKGAVNDNTYIAQVKWDW